MIQTVKGFGIVNKGEIDVFLELSFFLMVQRMLAIWSLVPLPFLDSAWTSGSSQFHVLLKPGLENFEHYFTSMWDECNCAVAWAFFGIAFLKDWNKNWPLPVLWQLLSFPNLLTYWVQHLILCSCSFLRNNSVGVWYLLRGRFIRSSHLLLMFHKCSKKEQMLS